VAADASAWFHDYRLSVDVFHFDHRRLKGACLRGWFVGAHGAKTRASLLSLDHGPILRLSAKSRMAVVGGHPNRLLPGRLAATVGCSGKLGGALAAAAQTGADLTVERAFAANRPTVALKFPRRGNEHVTLYLSPETDRPLVAIVGVGRGESVTARIYLSRVRRHLLAHFHLLRLFEAKPGR
jgi:hypothetical protein